MSKEEEIAKLLTEGKTPQELVSLGYSRGWVYRVNARLKPEGSTPKEGEGILDVGIDSTVESDPEVLELKKALRKAQLERQIAEVSGPVERKV